MSLMYIYVYNNGSHKRRGAKKQSPIYGKSPFMAFTMTVSIVANPQFETPTYAVFICTLAESHPQSLVLAPPWLYDRYQWYYF